jgi:hypothetical protein
MALHDPEYNDLWIRSLTKSIDIGHDQLEFIRSQVRASIPNHVAIPLIILVRRGCRSLLCFPRLLHS